MKKTGIILILTILILSVVPAQAEVGDSFSMIGEGFVELPKPFVKMGRGLLQIVGGIVLVPVKMFQSSLVSL